MPRRQVAFKEDIDRIDQALKEAGATAERGIADAHREIRKVSADLTSAVRKLDRAIEQILRHQAELARFFEVDAQDLPELRHKIEVLEGALGGARNLAQNVRTFGPQAGLALTVAEVVLGAAVGSQAEELRLEASQRVRARDDATVKVLRDVDARLAKADAEVAAYHRAQRGLR